MSVQSTASLRAVSHLQLCPSADSAQNVLDAGKKPIKEIPLAPCPQPLTLASPSEQFPLHCTSTGTCRVVLKPAP